MSEREEPADLEGTEVEVHGWLYGAEDGVAKDLSGIDSAAPLGKPSRKCLVIDNEGIFAQFVQLDLSGKPSLDRRRKVRLLPKRRRDIVAVGTPPRYRGPEKDDYLLDGEGVAWSSPYYYVTGSHSIHDWKQDNAEGSDYRRSAFLVARIGKNGGQSELSYRLNELLSTRKSYAPHYLQSPDKKDGINIEGVAARGRRLYFGFRSPVVDGKALILSVRAAALFIPDADLAPKTIRVPIGEGIGIRDLTALPDGRFLILAGPKPDGGAGFAIQLFDQRNQSVQQLGTLARDGDHKPEAMLLASHSPLPDGAAAAEILVLSDGPRNGSPRLYTLTIPP